MDDQTRPFSIWQILLSPTVIILLIISIGSAVWLYLAHH